MTTTDPIDDDIAEADVANGEPDATHPTNETEVQMNDEEDPPG